MKEFLDQLFLVIIYGGILQGVFVVLLLYNNPAKKGRANRILSILVIALSFSVFHIVYAGKVLNHFSVQVHSFGDPTFFLIAPLLWFYIKALTGDKMKFTLPVILHFTPFFILIILSLFTHWISKETSIIQLKGDHHKLKAIFFWTAVVIQFSCYQIFIHRKWLAYQRIMEQEVSNTEDVNISWVKFFMIVFLVINFFFLFNLFATIHLDNMIQPEKIVAIVFSLSIFALGYKGILQKEIFEDTASHPVLIDTVPPATIDLKKTDQQLIDRLITFMDDKQPYLDPELTITGLAKQLGISRNQLSQIINEGIGDNFYNFVNKYRVEQVKKLMHDPRVQHFNMLGMAIEAGFKSKSTFNLIFKRFTGLTPTEYRKNRTQ